MNMCSRRKWKLETWLNAEGLTVQFQREARLYFIETTQDASAIATSKVFHSISFCSSYFISSLHTSLMLLCYYKFGAPSFYSASVSPVRSVSSTRLITVSGLYVHRCSWQYVHQLRRVRVVVTNTVDRVN